MEESRMKSILKFSLLALAAAALFSCQKAETIEAPQEANFKTFTLTFAQPDSKVAITDAGKTTWEVGDEIFIHGKATEEAVTIALAASDISADGKTATITFDTASMTAYDPDGYYACYPADAVGYAGSRTYYYGEFKNTNRPLMAAYQSGDSFIFFNLCGAIRFTVSGEFDSYVFSGNSDEVLGYEYYQVKVNSEEQNFKRTLTGDIKKLEGPIQTTNYLFFPNGVNFAKGFTFKFKDGQDVVYTATSETPVEIPRNGILNLGDISGKLVPYTPPTTSDHKSAITGATDISAQQANCFVITAPGAYKFPALKGSSEEEVGNVFDVEILWETFNNAEEVAENSVIAAADFEDNWIYFQTPSSLQPGNAVIAARDVNDVIIWSWHIWIPQTAITDIQGYMSRNLGALVDATADGAAPIESCGLFYQFGRKDPFPCSASWESSSPAVTSKPFAAKSDVQITVAESIAHPTKFAYKGDTAVDPTWDGANWCVSADEFWDNAGKKTIYDPCPAGYKVPETIGGTWTSDYTQHWYKTGDLIFPDAGYMDDCGGSISKVGLRNKLWFSTGASEKSGNCIYAKQDEISLTSTHKACGAVVRCVKLESTSDPGTVEPTMPTGVTITIDGGMSEWAAIPGKETPNNICKVMKVYNDADNFYFYVASEPGSRGNALWGEGAGYYYFDFDLDNDASTGIAEGSREGLESYMYLYLFGGSAEAPFIQATPDGGGAEMSIEGIAAAGVIATNLIEIELSVPRANLPSEVTAGQKIRIISWRSKDGTVIENTYTVL